MAKKIDIIEYCGDCSKRYYDENDMYCGLTRTITNEWSGIPDWCPKENYIEKEIEQWITHQLKK